MDILSIAIAALFLLFYGLVSGRLEKSVITLPMAFTLFGYLISSHVLGLTHLELKGEVLKIMAELTLVLVLFTDASRIRFAALRQHFGLEFRLLVIALPLTIAAGAAVAVGFFPGLGFWGAAALAAILAPTDAALGQATVANPSVPARVRRCLNVESGLNDGLALPFVLFALSLASAAVAPGSWYSWGLLGAKQVLLGPLAGLLVGFLGGRLILAASQSGWMSHIFQDLSAVALSVLAYSAAEFVGGNGLLAAFVCGLTLGNAAPQICTCLHEFAEAEGHLLVLVTFLAFGAVMVGPSLEACTWQALVYAGLSLTLIRMLPVALSMAGARLKAPTVLFLGWFGPRGLASILYALLMLDRFDLPGVNIIFTTTIITVLISVFAHGLSAAPLARYYSARIQETAPFPEDKMPEEHRSVELLPTRLPYQEQAIHQPPESLDEN